MARRAHAVQIHDEAGAFRLFEAVIARSVDDLVTYQQTRRISFATGSIDQLREAVALLLDVGALYVH